MALSGDTKENFAQLHLSTGESFAHMAERIEHPKVLESLDAQGQKGNAELAAWLRTQKDDPEVMARHRPVQEVRGEVTAQDTPPKNRTSTSTSRTTA